MKRKTLTTAVLAGLTGMAGMVSVSNAVNLNPDGLGQVLLYPYYTARGGNDTFISIVNTTDNAKSVKVRFLEGLNSREVLDFNLYMSAFDVWVAAITATDDGGGQILIPDSTCTVPYFFGNDVLATGETEADRIGQQDFLTFGFVGDGGPVDGVTDVERTLSGYVEVIEMGTLTDDSSNNSATAATHVLTTIGGEQFPRPANCAKLVSAWSSSSGGTTGYWLADDTVDHDVPTGGLFGSGTIINVADGTMFSYAAEAIDNVNPFVQHSDPGNLEPDLNSGGTTSNVFLSGVVDVDTTTWSSGVEAISATILHDTIMNEYIVDPTIGGLSEWVVTFPTKRYYIDAQYALGDVPVDPFTSTFGATGACEEVGVDFWDREEKPAEEIFIRPIVSPRPPPGEEPDGFELCWEANVVRFAAGGTQPGNSEILKETRFQTFPIVDQGFDSGWARFDFGALQTRAGTSEDFGQVVYEGLPTIGFWVNTFTNGQLEGGTVLANYGGTFRHRGSRSVVAAPPPPPTP